MSKTARFDWRLILTAVVVTPLSILIGYVLINGVDLAGVARKFRHEARVEMMQEHVPSWDGPYAEKNIDSYNNYERSSEKPKAPLKLKLSTELSPVVNWDEWIPIYGYGWDAALSERK